MRKKTKLPEICEKIKTMDDVLKAVKMEPGEFYAITHLLPSDMVAAFKIRLIAEALNEGWVPTFDPGERRYYPWCFVCTEEFAADHPELHAKPLGRVVGRSSNNANAGGGLVCANANNASSYSNTYGGARLAFKTEALAEYAGEQFLDIYADFYFTDPDVAQCWGNEEQPDSVTSNPE
ncbi:MAG: hypothetical protein KBT20_00925 [Bacteroidales bacterium]|nr:hypothetical protein [Candidatus Liminaster caballi]